MSASGCPADGAPLERAFYRRDALVVAPDLLNKVLVSGPVAARIIEVEAYRQNDPASHSWRGRTPRNSSMFEAGGVLYVYLSYGIHHCLNVVTGDQGDGQAVLLRSGEIIGGHDLVTERRTGRPQLQWANGPGKLAQALAVDRHHDGVHLTGAGAEVSIIDDGLPPPSTPVVTKRIGITKAREFPWRWLAPAVPTR